MNPNPLNTEEPLHQLQQQFERSIYEVNDSCTLEERFENLKLNHTNEMKKKTRSISSLSLSTNPQISSPTDYKSIRTGRQISELKIECGNYEELREQDADYTQLSVFTPKKVKKS